MPRQDESPAVSERTGVEALIERLREQGVAAGRVEAEKLVTEAERRARWIVEQARGEADQIRQKAREEAERLRTSGEEALRVAARDVVLEMKDGLTRRFTGEIRRLVARELQDEAFLQRLILAVASRAREEGGIDAEARVEFLLPRDVVGLEELRRRPEELKEGTLSHFVLKVAGEILREGVSFKVSDEIDSGIRVRLVDRDVEIDLDERAIAGLLLAHLQPRFRALLEGIVR